MKFFNWMQCKFNGKNADKIANPIPATNHTKERSKEEFSDWSNELLAIGTLGNNDLTNKHEIQAEQSQEHEIHQDEQCSSPDFSEFTGEEVGKLQKELTKLRTRKSALKKVHGERSSDDQLPLDKFLNCPSSLDVDRTVSDRFSTYSDDKDEEEIDRTIAIILRKCKDICEKKKNKEIGKKSLSFLVKKMFVCSSSFVPAPSLRDTLQESRMEKLLKTMLSMKIYRQNSSKESSSKKYIEYHTCSLKVEDDEESHCKNRKGSKWDKSDSEYIVLDL